MKRFFVIYDDRAAFGNTKDAQVLSTAMTLKEAQRDLREMGYGVVFSYSNQGDQLVDERQETWPTR